MTDNLIIPEWIAWLMVAAGAVGAGVTIWKKVLRPFWNTTLSVYRLVELTPVVRSIAEQFETNGGSSLRDAIDRIEGSLWLTRQQVRASWGMMQVGVGETDSAGSCTYVNPYWCQLTGMPLDQALGNGWVSAVHEEDRDEVFGEWRDCVAQGRNFDMAFRYRHADGREIFVVARTQMLRDVRGRLTGYVATITPKLT